MPFLHSCGAGRRHSVLRGGLLAAGTMAATLSAGAPALAELGESSGEPTAPDIVMVYKPIEAMQPSGLVCPIEVSLYGEIVSSDGMTGVAILASNQDPSLSEAQSQAQKQEFSLGAGEKLDVRDRFQVQWSNVPPVGANPPKQTMTFQFAVERHNVVVAETQRTVELTCRKPALDLTLNASTTKEKLVRGFMCPSEVLLDGLIVSDEAMSGQAMQVLWQGQESNVTASSVKDIRLTKGGRLTIGFSAPVEWHHALIGPDDTLDQFVTIGFKVFWEGVVAAQTAKQVLLSCRNVQGGDGQLSAEDAVLSPQAVRLHAYEIEHTKHRGLSCPSKVEIHGVLDGRGTTSGAAALFADDELKALKQYSIEDGHKVVVKGEHALSWGPTQAQQNVKFAMNVTNKAGDLVDRMEATQNFACRKVETSGVAQGAVGGVTTGKPAPTTHSYQTFAIQAPRGLVRQGEIRLAGGAANGTYTLKFLRKNGGGYVVVKAAQLPKQMTGLVASFPLKALTGGRDWRLEVCSLGGTPAGCKTADFRLTRIGAGAGAATPSPEQPQGSVFIFPGAAN